ncbi:MAG: carboxypeptidase-like regulatory domain-containing protein, partial [Balneolales bacterium]
MKILYYRSLFIITALVLLSITGVYGQQNAVLYGEVTDTDNGEGLIGANVQLMGTNWGAATNVDGNYRITRITPGTYTLVISYLGYQRQEIEIELAAGEELEYNSEMTGAGIEGEEILFSVQAQGQRSAINQQLSSNTISNIVSRDRIREMPDVNAAESIGRLPGVSIQRSGGEANKIAIRGLSPKYNTVTVNGVRMPATGGDDRSVDLSLISSNMLDGIEVLKAITPDQDADAIGGSVDLRLREAPDQLMFDVAAQGGFTHLQNHYGNYKLTGSVSNRFLDNKLGVIANINLDEYDRSADKFSGDYRRSTNSETGETEVVAQSIGLREENVVRGRKGASIVLDYRIPHGKINANTFYNKLDNDGLYRINRMDVNANRHYYDLERRTGSTSVMVGGIGFEQDFDWINYDANVSRTSTSSNNPRDYTYHFVQESSAFQGSVTPGTDPNQIPGMATNDSTDTALQDLYTWGTDRNEHETAAQANFHIPFNLGSTIDG